jgi:hypothetical protein
MHILITGWAGFVPLVPVPTPETKTPRLGSVYALSKFNRQQRRDFVSVSDLAARELEQRGLTA